MEKALAIFGEWTEKEIEERGEELVSFAKRRWQV